jgi:hypothetical protein
MAICDQPPTRLTPRLSAADGQMKRTHHDLHATP